MALVELYKEVILDHYKNPRNKREMPDAELSCSKNNPLCGDEITVFVHDAIAYMTTEDDLRAVFATAFEHTRPGGVALFVPDAVTETFEPAAEHGGHDGPDRALRYLEWTWDPDPDDTTVRMDLTYVFHEPDGAVHAELDEHVCGLFPRATWLGLIERAGFEVWAVPLAHDERPVGSEGFLATRPR